MLSETAGEAWSMWLRALRFYVLVVAGINLIWEFAQLPLYTLWNQGTWREIIFAALHCTLGDILIASAALVAALIIVGRADWPFESYGAIALLSLAFGLAYTIFSEWQNVVMRRAWEYSDWMPIISTYGLRIGLSPLLQWIAVPAAAFAVARRIAGVPGITEIWRRIGCHANKSLAC
jgi:hypothetical protein